MKNSILALFLISIPALAQSPKLTTTEEIAIQAVVQQSKQAAEDAQKAQQEHEQVMNSVKAIEADITKTHPGFHLDEKTMQLAKDETKKP